MSFASFLKFNTIYYNWFNSNNRQFSNHKIHIFNRRTLDLTSKGGEMFNKINDYLNEDSFEFKSRNTLQNDWLTTTYELICWWLLGGFILTYNKTMCLFWVYGVYIWTSTCCLFVFCPFKAVRMSKTLREFGFIEDSRLENNEWWFLVYMLKVDSRQSCLVSFGLI